MSSVLPIEIAIILLLIVANGFFAASEIAIVSSRRGRLEREAAAGNRGAKQALELAESPDRFLATVQVGITLISTLAAAFGGARLAEPLAGWLASIPALRAYAEPLALGVVVALITYFSLVLGELVPKRLALQHAEGIAVRVAPILGAISRLARPAIAALTASAAVVLRVVGRRPAVGGAVTEEDIAYLVRQGEASGAVEAAQARFIGRVFRFDERPARAIMTPRPDIVALDVETSFPEVVDTLLGTTHSRIPIYEGTLDQVIGILYAKDLLRALKAPQATDIRPLLRPAAFVLRHQRLDDVLAAFRRQRSQLALVVDEYGQVEGLVTLADVLEELVGDLPPEHAAPEEPSLVQLEDGTWIVDGAEPYDALRERVGLPDLPPEERGQYVTVAGVVLARLDRIPTVGDTVGLGDFTLRVLDMDGRRIDKLSIARTGDG